MTSPHREVHGTVTAAAPFRAEPFAISVDPAVVEDMRARVRRTRLPPPAAGEPWTQGMDRDWLKGILDYWADEFDWEAAERRLNSFANYRARIGDDTVHFLHEKARSGDGIPLI